MSLVLAYIRGGQTAEAEGTGAAAATMRLVTSQSCMTLSVCLPLYLPVSLPGYVWLAGLNSGCTGALLRLKFVSLSYHFQQPGGPPVFIVTSDRWRVCTSISKAGAYQGAGGQATLTNCTFSKNFAAPNPVRRLYRTVGVRTA